MANLFALSWFVLLILVLACVLLVLDARGESKALRAALEALQRHARAQDEQIDVIGRTLTRISTRPVVQRPQDCGALVTVEFSADLTDTPSVRWLQYVMGSLRSGSEVIGDDTPAPHGQRVPLLPPPSSGHRR